MVQLVYICTCTTVQCCKPFQSIQICVNKLHRILHPKNEFYPKMKKLYTCTHTSVIQDVVCRVCRTYLHQSHRGGIFFYMTCNSDTLYRFLFQNTGFCGWEFEHAPIIEAMVRTSYNHRSHGFARLG